MGPNGIGRFGGEAVEIFVGSHEQRVDRKGRVSVPAQFRDVLGEGATFYAFPALLHRGVECRTAPYMKSLSEQIANLDPFSDEQDHLSAAIFGTSHRLTPDKDGRVTLPGALCEHAGISDAVMFVGLGESFQMWESEQRNAYQRHVRDRALADRKALRQRPQAAPVPNRPVESGT